MRTNIILQGDCLTELKKMPSETIDCVMTSPPYWALRDYGKEVEAIWDEQHGCEHDFEMKERRLHGGSTKSFIQASIDKPGGIPTDWKTSDGFCQKCGAWKGQLGLEPTFDLFIKHLCDVFDEVKRTLKKTGTCWVNLGDTYNSHSTGKGNVGGIEKENRLIRDIQAGNNKKIKLPDKTLAMIPFRFAIEMANRGWILRNTIIWHKPNVMPSSVRDRFTVDFEYIFFFVKSKKYFFEKQYEPHLSNSIKRMNEGFNQNQAWDISKRDKFKKTGLRANHGGYTNPDAYNPLGKNKRCVWKISTKPFKEAHFAVFPETLCETPIRSGCPEFVCNGCGKIRVKIYSKGDLKFDICRFCGKEKQERYDRCFECAEKLTEYKGLISASRNKVRNQHWKKREIKNVELSNCGCNAGFSGGIVLDPFFGSGTTGLVALKQNKRFIGIELNPEYIKIAKERLKPYLEQTKLEPKDI